MLASTPQKVERTGSCSESDKHLHGSLPEAMLRRSTRLSGKRKAIVLSTSLRGHVEDQCSPVEPATGTCSRQPFEIVMSRASPSCASACVAPCTPPTSSRWSGDVSPPRTPRPLASPPVVRMQTGLKDVLEPSGVPFKRSRHTSYDLVFDSVESFKKWLQTSSGPRKPKALCQMHGNILDRKTWDDTPGWGIIANLNIMSPAMFSSTGISSVMWIHWGNGSILVRTMSDEAPTPYRPNHKARISTEASEQAHRRVRTQLRLLRMPRSLSCSAGLPHEVWPRVLSFLCSVVV